MWDPVRAEALDYLCRILYREKYIEVYDRYCYNLETDTVTADKKILQIDYEGSACNTLYASDGDILEVWGYYDKCLYIREDNRMLELDLVELKYRTLISFDEGKIVYGVNRMTGDGFHLDVHHKDAVYVHTFKIKEEAFPDAREWSNYGDTVSEVE